MDKTQVVIRDVDRQAWRELRGEAVRQGLTTGEALKRAIAAWLSCERRESVTNPH